MFKSARVPERLFRVMMWVVSFIFAGFLIGLGSTILADLPKTGQILGIEQFADRAALERANEVLRNADNDLRPITDARERAQLELDATSGAYRAERETFSNWLATRRTTQDPAQDPEVITRTKRLDSLKAEEQKLQVARDAIVKQQVELQQRVRGANADRDGLIRDAAPAYQAAQRAQDLRIFGVRLAFTLPLLLIAGWLVMKKRASEYWPLMRGFVIAALFAFFVELVPYLPSYGGYVRYAVGILITALVGHYGIRWMRGYLARRKEAEKANETERRKAISYEEALKKMAVNVCPGCERPVAGKGGEVPDFCMHCGMKLMEDCGACKTHTNAFFHFCPSCGTDKKSASPLSAALRGDGGPATQTA